MNYLSPMLLCDFYKLSHRAMYPEGTEVVYSTWTPRGSRIKGVDRVVAFGMQMAVEKVDELFDQYFFGRPMHAVVGEYARVVKNTLGDKDPPTEHIEALHDLGYLPISVKALPEGTLVPMRVPYLTIQNTDPRFFWLTNYLETLLSCELWLPATAATLAHEYRKMLDDFAMATVGNTDFVPFQGHDFSMRGMSSLQSCVNSGLGHLTSFVGTDTIPAIQAAERYYDADVEGGELVGTSIPATEHSVQCAYGNDMAYFDNIINRVHPSGLVSIVSDGYDFWDVIGRVLPALKDKIMARDGKVVIRPDSGDPVKIVCGDPYAQTDLERKGAVEALWDIFGGTVTERGYVQLDPHIGLIYGDAITRDRAHQICSGLREKGFASTNVVFGIGSFTYQYNTRDTFGFAMKSTLAVINGVEKHIYKDPKTDDGVKKSQRGRVAVLRPVTGGQLYHVDGRGLEDDIAADRLREIYRNGRFDPDNCCTLTDIRQRLREQR